MRSTFSQLVNMSRQSTHFQDPLWYWLFVLLKPIHRWFITHYFRVEIQGMEHGPLESGVILAPKHSSRWDPLLLALLSSQPLRYVATHTEFQGFQGWIIRRLGSIPIVRDHTGASTVRAIESMLLAGQAVVIFPEGGIRSGYIGTLKPGLARIAIKVNRDPRFTHPVPIIPIAISYDPAPRWQAKVKIQVLPPLHPQELGASAESPAMRKLMAQAITQTIAQSFTTSLQLPTQPLEPNNYDVTRALSPIEDPL